MNQRKGIQAVQNLYEKVYKALLESVKQAEAWLNYTERVEGPYSSLAKGAIVLE
jgi:hypothetical protein